MKTNHRTLRSALVLVICGLLAGTSLPAQASATQECGKILLYPHGGPGA